MKEMNSRSINQGNVQDRGSHSSADEDRNLKEYNVMQAYIPYQRS